MKSLSVLMIGDVVGESGLELLEHRLPLLIKENSVDFIVVNGENTAGGFGLTAPLLERLFLAGVDVVSSGNHIWEQREFWPVMESEKRVIRPLNYPSSSAEDSPGRGWVKLEKLIPGNDKPLSFFVVNLQGREYMTPIDCPFKAFDAFEEKLKDEAQTGGNIILVDFHAESSREKEALGYYLDGRVSIVAGTHSHVQTADERILPNGSAYISDLGMTGIMDGIIGMDPKICLDRARNQVLYRMEVAAVSESSKTALQGIIAEIDISTCKAVSVRRIQA